MSGIDHGESRILKQPDEFRIATAEEWIPQYQKDVPSYRNTCTYTLQLLIGWKELVYDDGNIVSVDILRGCDIMG